MPGYGLAVMLSICRRNVNRKRAGGVLFVRRWERPYTVIVFDSRARSSAIWPLAFSAAGRPIRNGPGRCRTQPYLYWRGSPWATG